MHRQAWTTTELAARERTDGAPDHGSLRWVSTQSHWNEATWYLDNDVPGMTRSNCAVYWPTLAPRLLQHVKAALWSFLVEPQSASAPKVGSMPQLASGLTYLARWMEYRDYADFGELRAESCDQFITDLIDYSIAGGRFDVGPVPLAKPTPSRDEAEILLTESMVWSRINTWKALHRQREALRGFGIPPIDFDPFAGASANKLAKETAVKMRQRVPPIPDEIALPILHKAHSDLGVPADDLLQLLEIYTKTYPVDGTGPRQDLADRANVEVSNFVFGETSDGAGPWHSQLAIAAEGEPTVPVVIRRMISRIRAACAIVVHAAAGVRVNELCSIAAGWKDGAEFPDCIEVRPSKTRFNEILILKGRISKEEDQPSQAEWVIGSRVRGSSYTPSAAKALQVLERIYRPWRAICGTGHLGGALMLSFTGINGLARTARGLGPISSDRLRNDMQKYISEQVPWHDLTIPDVSRHGEDLTRYRDTRGACITPHQWRKTFALFIFRIDANMTGALAQQFKHLSIAMTEEAYVGNDPQLLQAFDDVQLQQTVRFFHQMATGRRLAAGRAAKLIERHEADLAALIAGKSGTADQRASIETFCVQQDLRIWFAAHGKCLIGLSPRSARCHAIAGTTHWTNTAPSFEHRTPSTCAGCDCFVVDPEHLRFWEERASQSEEAVATAARKGLGADYRVVAERGKQAKAFLRNLVRSNEGTSEQ